MHLFMKLHQLAAQRGDGLRPEWLDLMTSVMSADDPANRGPVLTVVQPGNHPDGVPVVPSPENNIQPDDLRRKASA